jgi:hypothetical protein
VPVKAALVMAALVIAERSDRWIATTLRIHSIFTMSPRAILVGRVDFLMAAENSSLRKVGLGAGVGVGVTAGVMSLGYSALKGVAWLDRRRFGINGDLEAQAKADLAEPSTVGHQMISTFDGGEICYAIREPQRHPEQTEPTTIVLLHGVTLGAAVWNHQFTDLPREFRVIAQSWPKWLRA